jgi:hydroxypyruvate reductase 1
MATLAASNVAGLLMGYPVWNRPDILAFLETEAPPAAPSIVNADDLSLPIFEQG